MMKPLVTALAFATFLSAGCVGAGRAKSDLYLTELRAIRNIEDGAAWIALARAYMEHGKPEEARHAMMFAHQADPELFAKEFGLDSAEPPGKAELELIQDPTKDEHWGNAGDYYASRGDKKRAALCYARAVSLDPSDGEWREKLIALGEGDAQFMEQYLPELTENAPQAAAEALQHLGRNDDALRAYMTSMEMEPSQEARNGIEKLAGSSDELFLILEERAKASEHDEILGLYALMLSRRGDQSAACEYFTKALSRDEGDDEWQGMKRRTCRGHSAEGVTTAELENGDVPAALREASQPDLLEVYQRLKQPNGQPEAAKLLEEFAQEEDHLRALFSPLLAAIRGQSMLQVAQSFQERLNDNDEANGKLGDEFLRKGQLPKALEAYQRALALDPEDGEWIWKRYLTEALIQGRIKPSR